MKKALSIILIILILTTPAIAETQGITIVLNGETMMMEEPAVIVEGRTLVPVKFIFEPLGLDVTWHAETRTATGAKENLKIDMTIDSTQAIVNEKIVELDVAATIINDRTYVPLRFVAESTGAVVKWYGDTRTITIDGASKMTYDEILKMIHADVYDADGPNMSLIRDQYHEVYNRIIALKAEYIAHDETLKGDMLLLANSCGLKLTDGMTLDQMMQEMYKYKVMQHESLKTDLMSQYDVYEFDNGDQYYGEIKNSELYGLSYYNFSSGGALLGQFNNSKRNGFLSEIHESGFEYSNFIDDKPEGLRFTYNQLEDSYTLGLVYYGPDKRTGIGHQITFDKDNNKMYDAYYKYEKNQSVGLEYVKYAEGYELFDRGDLDNDVAAQINPSGNFYIAPTDENGIADNVFTGFGYKRFSNGVEYIGQFDDWSLLADGMYFAPEDTSDISTNLVDQLAIEILDEIIKEGMSESEKIKVIHDYLANHIIYDPNPIGEEDYKDMSHTAYGALIDGVAVCDGYSEAFKYLLDKAAVENVLIFGEANEEGTFEGKVNHAWNLISVDGQYKHFDLTWNDDDTNNRIMYDFYNKNNDYFDDTHQWEEENYMEYLQ